jgi:hypothetical protein
MNNDRLALPRSGQCSYHYLHKLTPLSCSRFVVVQVAPRQTALRQHRRVATAWLASLY